MSPANPAGPARPSVLVVDDNEDLLEMMQMALEFEGYPVHGVSSPVQATLIARERAFDWVVSDLRMPSLDGLQMIGQIRQSPANAAIRAVLMSGQTDHEVGDLPPGCQFLRKPFAIDELLAMLSSPAG